MPLPSVDTTGLATHVAWLHAVVTDAQVVAGGVRYANSAEALDIVTLFVARIPQPTSPAQSLLLEGVLRRFLLGLTARIAGPRAGASSAGEPEPWQAVAARVIGQLDRLSMSVPTPGAADHPQVSQFHGLLQQMYATPQLRACDVARRINISVSHLAHVLKANTGHGFAWHLRMRRMSAATELLRRRTPAIKEVAADVGYSSVGQFDRSFRRTFGITPTLYRLRMPGS